MKRLSGNFFRKWDEREVVVRVFPQLEEVLADRGYEFKLRQGLIEASNQIIAYRGKECERIEGNRNPAEQELWQEMETDLTRSRAEFISNMERFDISVQSRLGEISYLYAFGFGMFYINKSSSSQITIQLRPQTGKERQRFYGQVEAIEKARSTSKLIVDFYGPKDLGKELKRCYQKKAEPLL